MFLCPTAVAVVLTTVATRGWAFGGVRRWSAMRVSPPRMSARGELDELRSSLVATIDGVVPLSLKEDHAAGLGARTLNEGITGSCDGYLGLPKIGWCSATRLDSATCSFLHLSAQVAPNYDVPHLSLDVTVPASGGPVTIDYDLTAREDVVGNKNYVANYYEAAEPWFDAAKAKVTLVPNAAAPLAMRALASPVALHAVANSVADASSVAEKLVGLWSNWLVTPTEINRMKRGAAYSRDTAMHKQRWIHYSGLVANTLGGVAPQRAAEIASALAGPGDEAYTGGGGGSAEGV
mmetsp:Transcript_20003/g.64428  ORF Transcript_20003/g.64428 Transcript_20003/m.64428 type:complete len:292 (+) Transcript_20003:225-1100(+)|eukprot:CAMPEP_0118908856 /NCGR_PEP_ID=MMETSP1166-20130328/11681_1 /TAXON_ID=1104430 /ORGANISM="Chrysoreinhardia sp, Strain CCMP3193" /LENGTH=291 /DNA_ID=CAMNT_0006848255 /DNA_START=172 /DNA_END=1047 /DNA_ORIENTATION=+